jgi:hypothetical protein
MNAKIGSKTKCLLTWIGRQDLDGVSTNPPIGPILDFLKTNEGVEAVLLSIGVKVKWPSMPGV